MSAQPPSLSLFSGAAPLLPAATLQERLPPGATVRFAARRAHVLRIDSGCAWVTLGRGPLDASVLGGVRGGDVFLHVGESLRIPAGTRAVIEAARGMELRFVWQPADAMARKAARRRGPGACDAPDAAACC